MSLKEILFFICLMIANLLSIGQRDADVLLQTWNDESLPILERMEAMKFMHYDDTRMYSPLFPDSVLSLAKEQLELAEKHQLRKWMSNALNTMGNYHSYRGEFTEALDRFEKCKELALEVDDLEALGGALFNMGIIFYKTNDYASGIPRMLEAADVFKREGSPELTYRPWSVIAAMYLTQGDRETSLKYYEMCKHIADSIGDEKALVGINYTIEMIKNSYKEDPRSDQSQNEYAQAALEKYEETDDPAGQLLMLADLASVLINAGEYDKAKEKLDRASIIAERAEDSEGIPILYMQLGRLYAAQNQHVKAISNLEKAFGFIGERHLTRESQGLSEGLYISYKATGRYKEALEMYEQTVALRDSLTNFENSAAVASIEIRAEYEKQKALDDLANEKQLAIEQQKKKNQQMLSAAIGGGLVIVSILTLVILNRLKVTRKQNEIIEEQKKEVEESEKYKEQFLANMSHEIRTPMHAISGMVKIIDRNEHPPSQDAYLSAMRKSCDNLGVILNDVLDLSKMRAGKLDIERIPMSPHVIVDNVVQILKFKAEEKGIGLSFKKDSDVPQSMMGDPSRMNQVLLNIANNAIKFTTAGSVEILMYTIDNYMKFAIKDTGIGISEVAKGKIFTAFNQAQSSTSRLYGGTGLGLSISKQLVELQNGTIDIESEIGVGSTFTVSMPIQLADVGSENQTILSDDNLRALADKWIGTRVLLVEDNPFNQMIALDDLRFYFKDVKVDTVENGALAVDKFLTEEYDLVLMDVQMPEMNGFEASMAIRELEKDKGISTRIPIIAMTASLLKYEINSCYQAGMDNYIPKPYSTEDLVATIDKELEAAKQI
ncbi:MAG: signal transduction histidine kinase/ActR/RegA family two-component response regulator [Flavobacteriales bacterium]|jgi:signal transduction histidine kinase/ActR/RegA family two-component response regulator